MKKIFTSIMSIVLLNCGHTLLAQTITTPTGTPLSVTSNIEVTGDVNIPTANAFKINGTEVLKVKNSSLHVGPFAGNTSPSGTGTLNTFIGLGAGSVNTSGSYNMFVGSLAGLSNTVGQFNMYLGNDAGQSATGSQNTFIGASAGFGVVGSSTGGDNVFIGVNSGRSNTSGSRNVFIGSSTGQDFATPANSNSAGSDNTYIGYLSKAGAAGLTNATAIGSNSVASLSNTVVLGNAATTITGVGLANSSGLRFPNLTSSSTATSNAGAVNKALSVDASGNVILVALTGVTGQSVGGPVAEKTWKEDNGFLYNNSTKGVVINGTGFDGQALIVKGKMLSEEVNVKVQDSDWPDYVFKPSYKRMTLDEVEKFININGHLPNVASATEMAATGNNLNKTDIKLLEKVEELTLYLLEMKKANEVQNAEIQNLKKQVKSLRKK